MVTRPARLADARVAPKRETARPVSHAIARVRPARRSRALATAVAASALLAGASACGPEGPGRANGTLPPVSAGGAPPAAAPEAAPESGGALPERPNVLFVVLDTVRADRLSVYGHGRPTTPALEALAARGTRFERAMAAAPWTVPSHASMFTGLAPAEHGAHHEHRALAPEHDTLAERLSEAGYRTAGFSANPFVGPSTRLDQGFATFENLPDGRAVTDAALDFLDAPGAPWLLMLNYMEAHLPFGGVPEPAAARFADEVAEELARALPDEDRDDPVKLLAFEEQFNAFAYACGRKRPDPGRMRALRALYDGALTHLDSLLAELLAGVRALERETVVVVVADHGELLGEHDRIEHQFSLLDPLLRVPLIVSWPGRLPEGAVHEAPVGTERLFDWVLAWSEGRGLSPRPAWQEPVPGPLIAEYYRPLSLLERVGERFPGCPERLDRRLTAVHEGRHKLVMDSEGEVRLYDLERDPGEQHDLRTEEPELAARLGERARARQQRGVARMADRAELPAVDEETQRRLEALGYAGP